MTTRPTDPTATPILERVAGRLDDLVQQLADLGQDVEALSIQLSTARAGSTTPSRPAAPPPSPLPPDEHPHWGTTTAFDPERWELDDESAPASPAQPVPPAPPASPVPSGPPVWQREGFVSTLVAVAGVGVTLVGVVMTLVLAAQAGYFGPGARVLAGAAFCAALVGLSLRLVDRPGGRVGAMALACTGIAGAYLDVLAASSLYDFVPPVIGLALALAVAAGGVALAVRWRVESLAVAVTLAAAALAPFITGRLDLMLVAYLLILQLVGAWPEVAQGWRLLAVARTAPVVIVAAALTASPIMSTTLLVLGLVQVIGLATLLLGLDAHDTAPGFPAGAALLSTVPLAMACAQLDTAVGTVLMVASALAIAALFAVDLEAPIERQAALGLALTVNLIVAVSSANLQVPGIGLALVSITAGLVAHRGTPVAALPIAAAFWALALLDFLARTPVSAVIDPTARAWVGSGAVLSGLLIAAATVLVARALVATGARLGTAGIFTACSVVIYGVSAATVALLNGLAPVLAPLAVTIEWALAAAAALILSVRGRAASTMRAVGLALTVAVLAKLFLLDLAFLDGVQRSATFLLVGVLLLFTGTKYARLFADSAGQTEPGELSRPAGR